MPIKGVEKFREKLPVLSGKKILILPIYVAIVVATAFAVFAAFDSLPATLNANEVLPALLPLLGVIVVMAVGLVLVWQMWIWRNRLRKKYGDKAYQHVFLFGFGGIIWILTVAINQYVPFYSLAPTFWAASPLQLLAAPLDTLLGVAAPAVFVLKEALALILLCTGLLMTVRAMQVFGVDYMVVLYLYFPKESKIQKNEIYSVLRHPTYAGAILVCLGGTFFTFTPLSIGAFMVFLACFYIHVHFVEEKELIDRFEEGYRDYRGKVPAFFVKPKDLGAFFRFLKGKNGR